ncbi:MAG: CDP-alcohol phosphatidyltransferase family protein [Candidatus Marinimicrobia bacterium]|nr:CDP-alcohol phosphatidyltransferase family protein [Candidatus Neomarinimicrobiota bacterium]
MKYKYRKKPKENDFLFSQLIQRPLVKPLVVYLAPKRVSPDVFSVLSIIVMFCGVCCLFSGNQVLDFIGALLLQVGNLLDCIDGDLARTRGTDWTLAGKYMDYLKTYTADVLVPVGLAAGVANYFETQLLFYIMVIITFWKIAPQVTREHIIVRSLEDPEKLIKKVKKDKSLITDIQKEARKSKIAFIVKLLKLIVGLPNTLPNSITVIAIAGFFVDKPFYNILKLYLTILVIVTYIGFCTKGFYLEYKKLKNSE